MPKTPTLRLLLGDQLNSNHSWYDQVDDQIHYIMMEIRPESEYVTHHIQKIVGIFQAMRCFASSLEEAGHQVHYYTINDSENQHSFAKNIATVFDSIGASKLEYQAPDEYRLDELLRTELSSICEDVTMVSTEHFYTERVELKEMFEGKKLWLMETFYRKMRAKHDVLMEEGNPVTGKWNYDHDNRKKLPKGHQPPSPIVFSHDVSELVEEIIKADLPYIGKIEKEKFIWPKDRAESLDVLAYFLDHLISNFGNYQDSLSNEYWSLYHCRLSFAINTKMLNPQEVVSAAQEVWEQSEDESMISTVEGFIRQILGWREYMRGIYWAHMPDYADTNYFNHSNKLPSWYWTGDTKMNCLSKAINQSLDYGYAHHIQRLMVTGNFALLAGIHPDEVDAWYLGIYVDAYDWVEITNTRGMSQYADGGIVATKPYISSASYIHKMGNHCGSCHYNYKIKTGDKACPFNSLYWNFLDRNRNLLSSNPRMGMMYRVWDKMDNEKQTELLQQADKYMHTMNEL